MYPPPYYTDNSPAFMAGVMREHSFAVLSMVDSASGITATHLPFVLKDEGKHGTLYGHMAKTNPQAELIGSAAAAMAVFSGPHAYISTSWYEKPQRQVPTWNYVSVHAQGTLTPLPQDTYMDEMKTLISVYEPTNAWSINEAEDYAQKIMNGIVYFKMSIETLQGFRKMSGNKSKTERANIIEELVAAGETTTANAMAEIEYLNRNTP